MAMKAESLLNPAVENPRKQCKNEVSWRWVSSVSILDDGFGDLALGLQTRYTALWKGEGRPLLAMEFASHLWTLLRRIVLADNDRLAAPSTPTSFVPLWAPGAPCCKTVHFRCALGLAMQNLLYFAGTHWSRVYRRRAQEKADDSPTPNKSTHALPRVFVSASNATVHPSRSVGRLPRVMRIAGPSSTAAPLASMQLAVNHRVGSVSGGFGVRYGWNLGTNTSLAIAHLRPGVDSRTLRRIPRVSNPSLSSLRCAHLLDARALSFGVRISRVHTPTLLSALTQIFNTRSGLDQQSRIRAVTHPRLPPFSIPMTLNSIPIALINVEPLVVALQNIKTASAALLLLRALRKAALLYRVSRRAAFSSAEKRDLVLPRDRNVSTMFLNRVSDSARFIHIFTLSSIDPIQSDLEAARAISLLPRDSARCPTIPPRPSVQRASAVGVVCGDVGYQTILTWRRLVVNAYWNSGFSGERHRVRIYSHFNTCTGSRTTHYSHIPLLLLLP
ncbi:hypothetical protein B0H16DRAFT_1765015 [Mycena metata]|uniref:Uncharacterized protein n=1 Tax=Mycena metata TaxID=1033252 RepID=A0AAD7MWM4_9AGAR|nr:hypothetical protein B0H16DRAFT_1765015 [Mycena metata]